MTFDIENFFQFKDAGKVKAGFSVKTEGGLIYDCKLVQGGSNGFFVVSNQQRSYPKAGGSKGYINAFMALRDTPAAKFFDDVAIEASNMLKQQGQQSQQQPQQLCTGQADCQCPQCGVPF